MRHLLPKIYKRVGVLIAFLSLITLITIKLISHSILNEYKDVLQPFSQSLIIVGLLLIILSKEKTEDEFVDNCRLKAFAFAFLTSSINSIFCISGFNTSSNITSAVFGIVFYQLLAYIGFFYFLKSGIISHVK